MASTGTILKEKRIEAGLTLKDISRQTKITLAQLEAIEAGNVGYFEDDTSFYRFRTLYYGRLLKVDEVELKKSIDQDLENYFQELSKTQQLKQIQIKENVKAKTTHTKSLKRKIDFPWISMVLVIIVVIAAVGFVFINQFINNQASTTINEGIAFKFPLVVDPGEIEIVEEPVIKELSVKKIDGLNYEIINSSSTPILTVLIKEDTYLWFKKNNKALANPKSGVRYNTGETNRLEIPLSISNGDVIQIDFGYIRTSKVLVDGIEIPLNSSYPDNSAKIKLTFKEE